MIRIFVLLIVFFLFRSPKAWAYIDPGSGGYLINSILVSIGSIFAFASAFVILFFRNIGKGTVFLWRKHRFLFMAGILVVLFGLGFVIYWAYKPPSMHGLIPTPG